MPRAPAALGAAADLAVTLYIQHSSNIRHEPLAVAVSARKLTALDANWAMIPQSGILGVQRPYRAEITGLRNPAAERRSHIIVDFVPGLSVGANIDHPTNELL